MKTTIVLTLIFINFMLSKGQICGKISISSNNIQYESDMVEKGIVNDKWTENSLTPIIIDNEKRVDYIYVNILNNTEKLDVKKSFNLE